MWCLRAGLVIGVGYALLAGGAAAEEPEGPEPPAEPPSAQQQFWQCVKAARQVKVRFDVKPVYSEQGFGPHMTFWTKKWVVRLPRMPAACDGKRATESRIAGGENLTKGKPPIKTRGNNRKRKAEQRGDLIGAIPCGRGRRLNFDIVHRVVYADATIDRSVKRKRRLLKKKFRYGC